MSKAIFKRGKGNYIAGGEKTVSANDIIILEGGTTTNSTVSSTETKILYGEDITLDTGFTYDIPDYGYLIK